MEAASVPGGEQPAEQTTQTEQGGQTQEGAPPWAELLEQSFSEKMGQLQEQIGGQPGGQPNFRDRFQQEPEPQEPYNEDLGYMEDPLAGADPNDIRQIIQSELAPLNEGFREQQWASFMQANPELNDERVAGPVADMVQAMAEAAGDENKVDDPRFVGQVYSMYRNMQNTANQAVSEGVRPIVDAAAERAFSDLEGEFPKLQTEEGRKELVNLATEMAQAYGDPKWTSDPKLVRMLYLAQQGEARAAGEQPVEDGSQVALEQGGGTPSEPQEESIFHRINAKRRAGQLDWD